MDRYVLRWRGQIKIPSDGSYKFQTRSDDGSLLYIDQKLVVSNDGLHGAVTKLGAVSLAKGTHDLTVSTLHNFLRFSTPGHFSFVLADAPWMAVVHTRWYSS
jgi:hypothetical protein